MGAPVTCYSSQGMSALGEWKEGATSERDRVFRMIAAEFGVVCLAVSALVETVACGVLERISAWGGEEMVAKIVAHPKEYLSSSGFTIFWAAATAIYTNLFGESYDMSESHARRHFQSNFTSFMRKEDDDFTEEYVLKGAQRRPARLKWQRQLEKAIAKYRARYPHLVSNEDSSLFVLEMLRGTNYATRNAFEAVDATLFQFLFAKAVFEYTLGSRRESPIPMIFQPETQAAILVLRTDEAFLADENSLRQFFAAQIQDGTAVDAAQEDISEGDAAVVELELGERGLRGSLAECPESYAKMVQATGAEFRGGQMLGPAWQRALKIFNGESLD